MAITDLFGISTQARTLFQWLSNGYVSSGPLALSGPVVVGNQANLGSSNATAISLDTQNSGNQVWLLPQISSVPSLSNYNGAIAFYTATGMPIIGTNELGFRQIAQSIGSASIAGAQNTTSEVTLRSITIGGSVPSNRRYRWVEKLQFVNFSGSSATFTIRFYVGTQSLAVVFRSKASNNISDLGFLEIDLNLIIGSSGFFHMDSVFIGTNIGASSPLIQQGHNQQSINTTGGVTLKTTAQMTVASNAVITSSLSWSLQSSAGG